MTDEPMTNARSNRPPLLNEAVRRVLDWHRSHAAPMRSDDDAMADQATSGGSALGAPRPTAPDRDGTQPSA